MRPSPEYRCDHLATTANRGKLEIVRSLVHTLRRTATEEAHLQWRQFFQTRWVGFESVARAGWSRPWVQDQRLTTTFAQQVMSQVAGSLQGYWGNVQNTYTELVSGSTLPDGIRHQLHFINRRQAWFWTCDVALTQTVTEIDPKTQQIRRVERQVTVAPAIRALARTLIRRALSKHRRPHFRRFQPQLDQRTCFLQSAHTAEHPDWLVMSTLEGQRLSLPLVVHEAFRARNQHAALYQALAKAETAPAFASQAKRRSKTKAKADRTSPTLPPGHLLNRSPFLAHRFQEEDAERARRNPHPSTWVVPNTVRLMLRDECTPAGAAFNLTIGVVSDMAAAFAHQAATYQPRSEKATLALDLGLSTLLATADGELHGRNWLQTLTRVDKVISGIAQHRQRLGLRVASERYRLHVQRLRGWLKTEIHRILNRLIERKRPAKIIVEATDFFRSPKLSRRLNRLISNFGRGLLTQKLTEIESRFGITIEARVAAYTSQECHACGYVDQRNRVSQSQFCCRFCGSRCQADIQAARVLRDRRSIAASPRGTAREVRPTLMALVNQFNQRFNRPRGGPADPRWSNPDFKSWVNAVRSPGTDHRLQVPNEGVAKAHPYSTRT